MNNYKYLAHLFIAVLLFFIASFIFADESTTLDAPIVIIIIKQDQFDNREITAYFEANGKLLETFEKIINNLIIQIEHSYNEIEELKIRIENLENTIGGEKLSPK
jgi:hypothetical protein